ncbi:MAG: aldose 1-epimerase family protein [Prevotella sp.]|nr:aldose 1-epimerase family protein [Prevotella sp.]
METLKNEQLQIAVNPLGAELQSIKDSNGKEYLWQADPNYWARHSPILFPIVCGLWQGHYRIDGFEYPMERHGFARDMEFKLIARTEQKVTFALEDTLHTRRIYPYHFMLSVTYRLDGNKIHVIWHVHNTDDVEIHFQIGGHPAFYVPDLEEGEPMAGTMKFDNEGAIERIIGNMGGCIIPGRFALETEKGLWKFNEESFKEDAIIIDKCQVKQVQLLDKQQRPVITVDMKTPAVGIWSPYGKHAPFVCIEPWYGVHDTVEYRGDFRKKALMNHLQPGASFLAEYTITVG